MDSSFNAIRKRKSMLHRQRSISVICQDVELLDYDFPLDGER